MSDDSNANPSNRMSERVSGKRFWMWFLLGGDRRAVTTLLAGAVFAALLGLGLLDTVPLSTVMVHADPAETLFQALTGAIITGVTLVVTLSQLVLSQELGPVGDQRQRMEGAMDFREDSEDALDVPIAPPEPAAYLRAHSSPPPRPTPSAWWTAPRPTATPMRMCATTRAASSNRHQDPADLENPP